jgi:tetratricopeptide (TPR) repeat protein
MKAMKKERATRIRRAALAAGVGAALAAGAFLFVPDMSEDERPSGPEARAMAAVGAGAPAAPQDLTALIRDRESWLRGHPEDEKAWALLGAAYVDQGVRRADSAYYPKAEQALLRSLAVVPGERGNVEALVGLGSLANARHDFVTARKWGEAVRKQRPGQWTAYPVLIDAYTGLGDYEAAGKAHDKLKELRSGAVVLARSAEVYRSRGWREDATAKATEAAARAGSPTEKAASLHELGELAWERGEPKEALGYEDAALEAAPGHSPSLAGRARALAALGRTDEAQRDYQRAVQQLPLPEYALEFGEFYDSLGLDGDARTQYASLRDRAARAQADGVDEELVLARYEADHGDPLAAVGRLKAEWGLQHRSVEVADALGWALYRAGNGQEALKYAKRATDQGLRSALFSYHRGEIERSLEMYGPARRHLEEALRIHPFFSPLLAPLAREVLEALGQPSGGGPQDMSGTKESGPLNPVPSSPPPGSVG